MIVGVVKYISSRKFTRISFYLFLLVILVLLSLLYRLLSVSSNLYFEPYPIAVWWTPFTPYPTITRTCPKGSCVFVQDHSKVQDPLTEAVLFYGSQFKWDSLPLPRDHTHYWALFHEESPKNNWGFADPMGITLFNITSTFSRHSSYPLVTQYLKSISDITTPIRHSTATKNVKRLGLGLVMYLQTDCDTPSDRDAYVTELMKYITVDSYGKCLHTRDLPDHLRNPVQSMDSDELLDIIGQYKFVLAFENAICEDYVTEKLWRSFIAGSVPVYKGSPTVKDWAPSDHSIILVDDFKGPKELAEYLKFLDNNDVEYDKYLSYKTQGVTNRRLSTHMENRGYFMDDPVRPNMVEGFECTVCDQIHKRRADNRRIRNNEANNVKSSVLVANVDHYDCQYPTPSVLRVSRDFRDNVVFWRQIASLEGYRARAVLGAVSRGADSDEVRQAYSEAENQVTYKDFEEYRTKDFLVSKKNKRD